MHLTPKDKEKIARRLFEELGPALRRAPAWQAIVLCPFCVARGRPAIYVLGEGDEIEHGLPFCTEFKQMPAPTFIAVAARRLAS